MRLTMGLAGVAALLAAACSGTGGEAAASNNAVLAAQPAEKAQQGPRRGVEDPRAFVESVYRTGLRDGPGPVEHAYSERLRSLFATAEREAGEGMGRLDFDYWSNSQDPEIAGVRVTEQAVEGTDDRRIVSASFTNGGRPLTNRFFFERVNGRWFLDDVRNVPAPGEDSDGWVLSLILKYGD